MFELRNRTFTNKINGQDVILIPVETKNGNNCIYCGKLIDAPRKHALGLIKAVDYQIAIPINSNNSISINGININNSSNVFGCCLCLKGGADLVTQGYIPSETQKIENDGSQNKQISN